MIAAALWATYASMHLSDDGSSTFAVLDDGSSGRARMSQNPTGGHLLRHETIGQRTRLGGTAERCPVFGERKRAAGDVLLGPGRRLGDIL